MLRWTKDWVPVALLALPFLAGDAVAAPGPAVPALQLKSIAEIPLGGHPTRLDYASLDAGRHLLFIAHLGDSEVIVFDTEARRVVKRISNVSRVHGVLAIPELGRVYASATGTDEVVAIDEATLRVIARMPGGDYPDGLAYSPETHKGNAQLIVVDLRTGAAIAQFPVVKDPDVLAFDARLQTLYVAGEWGEVSEFNVSDG